MFVDHVTVCHSWLNSNYSIWNCRSWKSGQTSNSASIVVAITSCIIVAKSDWRSQAKSSSHQWRTPYALTMWRYLLRNTRTLQSTAVSVQFQCRKLSLHHRPNVLLTCIILNEHLIIVLIYHYRSWCTVIPFGWLGCSSPAAFPSWWPYGIWSTRAGILMKTARWSVWWWVPENHVESESPAQIPLP